MDPFTYLVVIIAFVHAHSLRLLGSWLGSLDRSALQGGFHHLHVVAVRAINGEADGQALAFDQQTSFDPAFGAIGRVFAGFLTSEGRLNHAAIHAEPGPVNPR